MNIPDRIYAEYRTKPKAVAWYKITETLGDEIANAATDVRGSYDIDNNVGEQLNVIGRIVVADRNYLGNTQLSPGLFALTDGDQFGDTNAMFSAATISGDALMSDDFFRLVIKAKIVKNNSDATFESILAGFAFLVPNANVVRIIDNENMSFGIEFSGQLTDLERWALVNAKFIPKPQAVHFNGFLESFSPAEFGDTSVQFGDTTAQFYGYIGV